MGAMKDFLTIVRNGGDEAVAAVQRMGDDWRAMLDQAASEVEAMRLTDAEREALEAAIGWIESPSVDDEAMPEDYLPITDALRGLLKRMSL